MFKFPFRTRKSTKKTFWPSKLAVFYSALLRIYTYFHILIRKKAAFGGPETVFVYLSPRRSIASTMIATAPSPVTLVAVPKLSMAM